MVEYKGGNISVGTAHGQRYWNITSDTVLTGNLVIGAGGVVTVDHGGIIFSQETGHEYTLIIEDGGKLILKNSTLTTRINNLQTVISLGVYVHNGSELVAYDSHLRFPGHLVIEDSNLTLWRSSIEGHATGLISKYCDPILFPAEAFNDAPVMLFMDSTVNLFDSRLEDIYEGPRYGSGYDLTKMYNHTYGFATDVNNTLYGNRTGVTYHLDSFDGNLDTYGKVTLAGNTALTSVNTYIGVDFSDDNEEHNAMVLRDSSTAYIYGLTIDEDQQPDDFYERQPAFVTIEGTYEAVVSSQGDADTTAETSVGDATASDGAYYRVNLNQVLNFNQFNIGNNVFPIKGAVLNFRYMTSSTYDGTNVVQWSNGSTLTDTTIIVTQQIGSFIDAQYDLYAQGIRTIEDVQGLTVQLTNAGTSATSYLEVDKVWIEVTTAPTVYIYRWANVTAQDPYENPISGAVVDAKIELPTEIPAYYYTPSGTQLAPPAEVLGYLGTDAAHFKVTGNDGKVSIPLLSETLNSSRLNPYAVYSYNLTVSRTVEGATYYNSVGVGHHDVDGNPGGGIYTWGQYPDLLGSGMSVKVPVGLTNLIFLPDLYISDISFSSNPTAGSEVTATITISNQGHMRADNFAVELWDGNMYIDGSRLLGSNVTSVLDHNFTVITIKWVPDRIGNYPIYVYVNSNMIVAESDFTNNVVHKNIAVSIKLDGDVFEISGTTSLTLSSPLSPAQTIVIREHGSLTIDGTTLTMQQVGGLKIIVEDYGVLRLENRATLGSTGTIDLHLFDNARLEVIKSTVTDVVRILPYQESRVVVQDGSTIGSVLSTPASSSAHLLVENSTLGEVTLTDSTEADFVNVNLQALVVKDSARVNHSRLVQIAVVDGRGSSLSGAVVTIRPQTGGNDISGTTGANGRVTLVALADVITSTGTSPVSLYTVNVAYTTGGQTYHSAQDLVGMPAFVLGSAISQGLVTLKDNNGNERAVMVSGWEPILYPADLAVSNMIFDPSGTVQVGTTVTITVSITNNGEEDSTSRLARFYLGTELIGTVTISAGLGSGETVQKSINWEATVPLGQRGDVDSTIKVVLSNATDDDVADNELTKTIKVREDRPDVKFWDDDISIFKFGSTTETNRSAIGDKVTITAIATAEGGTAKSVMFYFYANNIDTGEKSLIHKAVSDVNAETKNGATLTFTWTINVTEIGNYTIEVVANADGLTPESNIFNNNITKMFTVTSPEPIVTLYAPGETYKPGQDVLASGIVTNKDGTPIMGATVSVDLYGKNGVPVNGEPYTQITGENGEFAIQVHIPEGSEDGQYELRVTATFGEEVSEPAAGFATVKNVSEGGAPWWLYLIILAIVSAVIIGFSAYLYKYGLGKMVECGECGALIPESSKRCPKCGVEFETGTAKCSKCGAWIAANSASCPDCGAKFITEAIEEEEDEYLKNMREQYESFVDTYREEAKKTLDKKYSDAKFPDWWKKQPTYVSFENWLSQEEDKRKIGGVACPTCGILNPRGASICHKCGSPLELSKTVPVAPALAAPAAEEKPEAAAPKPLRRIVRRPVEKKPAAPAETKPEEAGKAPEEAAEAPAPGAPEAAKPSEPQAEEKKPEDKPEENKPSS